MNNVIFRRILIVGLIILLAKEGFLISTEGKNIEDTIFVDDDALLDWYDETHVRTIQEGIDTASKGMDVFVYNGFYQENIVIDKTINLIGEDKNFTIIDGGGIGNTVDVTSMGATISRFTISNGSTEKNEEWYIAGLRITSSNNIIKENIFYNNKQGIFCKQALNITIFNNEFIGDGITLSLYDNEIDPILFCEKYFIHNIFNNTVNGKKLYYYKHQQDVIVPEYTAGQIIAVGCKNLVIKHADLINADFGIILVNCSNCLIEYSNISSGDGLLWLIHSKKNKIQNNIISNNFEGVCLDYQSTRNIIRYNTISNNRYCGIIVEKGSNHNLIFRNNFIKNGQNAYFISCFKNHWIRNYWNGSRIIPKLIFGNMGSYRLNWYNIDYLPAQKPYSI